MTRLANEHGAINLSQGFPDFDARPTSRLSPACRRARTSTRRCPVCCALREALAARYDGSTAPYDPVTEVTVTAGATEALFSAITALVHPGDEVLAVRAVLRLVRAGGPARRRRARVRDAAGPELRDRLGRVPRRTVAADAAGDRQLTAQPDRDRPRRPTTCGRSRTRSTVPRVLVLSDEVYEHLVFDGRGTRASRGTRSSRRAAASSAPSARRSTPPAGRSGSSPRRGHSRPKSSACTSSSPSR